MCNYNVEKCVENPSKAIEKKKTLSGLVNKYIQREMLTQKDFADKCDLSETIVSRIIKNTNHKGKGANYKPSEETLISIALGLKLTREEYQELVFAAFPEREIWMKCLDERCGLHDAKELLEKIIIRCSVFEMYKNGNFAGEINTPINVVNFGIDKLVITVDTTQWPGV